MTPESAPATGLLASLRRLFATVLALIQTRIELVAVELEEQIAYAASLLLWSIAALFFLTLTLLLLALSIIIACWDQHRLLAALLVTGAFGGFTSVAVLRVRTQLRRRPRFLAATTDELRADAEALDRERP